MYDVIIRGGSIVDGTGAPAMYGDIAVLDGKIAAIGALKGCLAHRTIEADGALVTPGFIDLHSHYDGQFIWDDRLDPSFSHGVTTTIAGNCGVGFAPARVEHRRELMDFMTGVEDSPGIVLDEGLDWSWKSFPDYLDRVAANRFTMDVAMHIPHAPVRVHVMGDRALRHEEATREDIEAMAGIVSEGMAAGAMGFSTGRIVEHRSANGNYVPGTFSSEAELVALGKAMAVGGRGVFQVAPRGEIGSLFLENGSDGRAARLAEHRLLENVARASGRPVNYGLLEVATDPDDANIMIAESEKAIAAGTRIYPMISPRGAGLLYMLDGHHLFLMRPSYREVAHLPLAERLVALRDPTRRAAILREQDVEGTSADDKMLITLFQYIKAQNAESYVLTSPLDFEPGPEQQLRALSSRSGKSCEEYLYDHYTAGDGSNFNVNLVMNYVHGNLDSTRNFLMNPNILSGLADGGAHLKTICDAAMPTFQLAYWTRDRMRGERVPLELMVHKLTGHSAWLYDLHDRGTLAVGKRADINVIDYERLTLPLPRMVHDLPSGGARIVQGSRGYLATLVAGVPTRLDDEDTGGRPGRLVRATEISR